LCLVLSKILRLRFFKSHSKHVSWLDSPQNLTHSYKEFKFMSVWSYCCGLYFFLGSREITSVTVTGYSLCNIKPKPICFIQLLLSSSISTTTLSWVSACSTVVAHSQQEGFTECRYQRHVQPPTWRRTRDLERSNFRHKRPPASEATLANPATEVGIMGEKWPRNFAECGDFHVTFGFLYMP
jgi:hypothetical protein